MIAVPTKVLNCTLFGIDVNAFFLEEQQFLGTCHPQRCRTISCSEIPAIANWESHPLQRRAAKSRKLMKTAGSALLVAASLLSFGIALLHAVMIAVGPRAYLYFGAAQFAELAGRGSIVPAAVTLGITGIFAVFGLYGLAGAGVICDLRFVRTGLATIGAPYTLRGLVLVLDLVRLSRGAGYPVRQTVFSAVSLSVVLLYFVGVFRCRVELSAGGGQAAC